MSTAHNTANKGDFAKTVIMPGDPLRAKYIAETFLDDARLVNNVRGIQGYTGTYHGKPVSVMASGMGMPSMGIYSYELFNFYDVDNIIRVGSAGGIAPSLKLRDVVIGAGACTNSNFAHQYGLPGAFAPFSVFLLTKFMRRIPMAVIESAKIDGANEWHIFWNICLPQCRSALYSIAILVFIDNWNMVEQPLILLNDVEKQPLSMFLSSINAGEIGIAFAAAVIYMIPGLLLFLHGEAYLVEGIAHSGSVKG